MDIEADLAARVRSHAALGEPHRLRIVDLLRASDRTPSELRELTGLSSNLLAFHLDVLDEAGLVLRRRSQGDGRVRYVTLQWEQLEALLPPVAAPDGLVVFVCTRNAARSQIAAALWRDRTGREAFSAGADPAQQPDELAREVAAEQGLDPTTWRTKGYQDVTGEPALVVSVCDRARESGLPWTAPRLHWSVPDPAGGGRAEYQRVYRDLERRVSRLSGTRAGAAA